MKKQKKTLISSLSLSPKVNTSIPLFKYHIMYTLWFHTSQMVLVNEMEIGQMHKSV